jgi:hypothetical protein
MITYEVHLNGQILTVAGAEDLCVLSLTLAAVGELGPERAVPGDRLDGVAMDLHVGGLRAPREDDDHVVAHWVEESPIKVGDEIVIRVKEAQTAHPSARRSSVPQLEDVERDAFDAARETYFRLRHKYQADS